MREFLGGLRLIRRHLVVLTLLGLQFGAMCLVLCFVLVDVLTQGQALLAGQKLRAANATVFTVNYTDAGKELVVSSPAHDRLQGWLENGDGYTVIHSNAGLDLESDELEDRMVIVSGDRLGEVFPRLDLCSPAPCAMRGAGISLDDETRVDIVGESLATQTVMRSASTLFTPNMGALELDDKVLVRLLPEQVRQLSEAEQMESMQGTVLFDVPDEVLGVHLAELHDGGLTLVPVRLATDQFVRMSRNMVMAAAYVIGALAFLALMLTVFTVTTDAILRREAAGLRIRRRYGAGNGDLAARIAGLVLPVILGPSLPPLLLLTTFGDPIAPAALWIAAGLCCVALVLWARAFTIHVRLEGTR